MTEIRFYHLSSSPLDRAMPALLQKMLEAGHRVVLLTDSEERMNYVNDRLWTYSTNQFVPHGSRRDGYQAEQPVFLTTEEENPNRADTMMVYGDLMPGMAEQMKLCIDIFEENDPAQVEAARKRWKSYKENGAHALTYWKQDEAGKWQKG